MGDFGYILGYMIAFALMVIGLIGFYGYMIIDKIRNRKRKNKK